MFKCPMDSKEDSCAPTIAPLLGLVLSTKLVNLSKLLYPFALYVHATLGINNRLKTVGKRANQGTALMVAKHYPNYS